MQTHHKENVSNQDMLEFMDQTAVSALWQLMLDIAKQDDILKKQLPPDLSFYFDSETLLARKYVFQEEWQKKCKIYLFKNEEDFLKNRKLLEKSTQSPMVFIIGTGEQRIVHFSNNGKPIQRNNQPFFKKLSLTPEEEVLCNTALTEKKPETALYILDEFNESKINTPSYKNSYIYSAKTHSLYYVDRTGILSKIEIKNPKEFYEVLEKNKMTQSHYSLNADQINRLITVHTGHAPSHHCLSDSVKKEALQLLLSNINTREITEEEIIPELAEQEIVPNNLTNALRDRTLDMIARVLIANFRGEKIPDNYRLLLASIFHPSHWVATIVDLTSLKIKEFDELTRKIQQAYQKHIEEIASTPGYVIEIVKTKPDINTIKENTLYVYQDGENFRFIGKNPKGIIIDEQYAASSLSEDTKKAIMNGDPLSEKNRLQLFNHPSSRHDFDSKERVEKKLFEKYGITPTMSREEKIRLLQKNINTHEVKNLLKKELMLDENPDALLNYFEKIAGQLNDSRDPTIREEWRDVYYDSARLQLNADIPLENQSCAAQQGNTCADMTVANCFYQGLLRQTFLANQPGSPTSMDWRRIMKKIQVILASAAIKKSEIEISELSEDQKKSEIAQIEAEEKALLEELKPELTELMLRNYDYNSKNQLQSPHELAADEKIPVIETEEKPPELSEDEKIKQAVGEANKRVTNHVAKIHLLLGDLTKNKMNDASTLQRARAALITELENLLLVDINYNSHPLYDKKIFKKLLGNIPQEKRLNSSFIADQLIDRKIEAIVTEEFIEQREKHTTFIRKKIEEIRTNITDPREQQKLLKLLIIQLLRLENGLENSRLPAQEINLQNRIDTLLKSYSLKKRGLTSTAIQQITSYGIQTLPEDSNKNAYMQSKKSLMIIKETQRVLEAELSRITKQLELTSEKPKRRHAVSLPFWLPKGNHEKKPRASSAPPRNQKK